MDGILMFRTISIINGCYNVCYSITLVTRNIYMLLLKFNRKSLSSPVNLIKHH